MLRVLVSLLLLQATEILVQGQDCNTDGIKLGEVCAVNTDCNVGDCPIAHSKCSDGLVCACTIGYSGTDGTRTCAQVAIGSACSTDDVCAATTPNSYCYDSTVCGCAPGFYEEQTRLGEKFCASIDEKTACTPGVEGDAFCAAGDLNVGMTCDVSSNLCACPTDNVFIRDITSCELSSTNVECAACINTGGICYTNGTANFCSCPTTKYSSTDDALSTGCDRGSATVGDICQEDGSVTCEDTNAECVHFGTMTKRYICQCKMGYVRGPEWGSPDHAVCHKELSSRQDENCAQCNINDGECYDIDGDFVHDVCKCPTSTSTSNADDYSTYCDIHHVEVSCDSDSMNVCYSPHNTIEFPNIQTALSSGNSLLFVKNKIHDQNCYLQESADGWCIDLEYGTFLSCDTTKNDLNEHTVSYTNWIILQRQPEKRTINDMYIYVYCSYDSLVNAYTGHVAVEIGEPPAVAAEGDLIQAGVSLDIVDQFGNDAGRSGVILGQLVQLISNITDDRGVFREIKAEVCLASNLPDLSSPFSRTTLMMYDGCPETNSLLDEDMLFTEDIGNPKVTRTNLFSMFKFDDSEYVFFHCAMRVCMEGNTAECDPSVCAKRKRRSITSLTKRNSLTDERKHAKALASFSNPDLQVSVRAVRIKTTDVATIDSDAINTALVRKEFLSPSEGGSVDDSPLGTNMLITVVGGGVGFVVLIIVVVLIAVVILSRSTKQDTTQDTYL